MEQYKLDNYSKEYQVAFPTFKSLSTVEVKTIRQVLLNMLQSDADTKLFPGLSNVLPSTSLLIDELNKLGPLLAEYEFGLNESIFVFWSEDNIDKFEYKQLIEIWGDIWCPDSDEAIILFQMKSKKLLLLTHYGQVFYKK